MSDNHTSIVSEKTNINNTKELGEKVLQFLIERKIIEEKLTDCTLGVLGYKPGSNFLSVLEKQNGDFLNLGVNGLEVITKRTVFHSNGENLEGIYCPNCKQNQIEKNWSNALDSWYNKSNSDLIKCSNCSYENSITKFIFEPNWAFGDFGLVFWNWGKFKNQFFTDLEKVIGTEIKVIYGKV
ncbi:hypothetical protein [Cellulophaga fucicola]|uniref:Uncharacterized protein n=1 Tax=Cellulophaga fucicola TaxID=76595 RepID=A0A1K1PR49_9FLAO|nr:hypothetical protein [Cellulophaga fucicola]SFW49931.1 hypothetical protein SAMN05660313_02133 [Cellulophaga fucicola]